MSTLNTLHQISDCFQAMPDRVFVQIAASEIRSLFASADRILWQAAAAKLSSGGPDEPLN